MTTHLHDRLRIIHEEQFKKILPQVDIVSFDFFDTLVQRRGVFIPKDLFLLVEEKIERTLKVKIKNFASLRIKAEDIARARLWKNNVAEIHLDDIYRVLSQRSNLPAKTVELIKNIEIQCELEHLSVNISGKHLFDLAVKNDKKIIVTTDTYLDKNTIKKISELLKYTNIENFYVSSEIQKTKSDGGMFDYLLSNIDCPAERILHVGDNKLSDLNNALDRGIRTHFISSDKQFLNRDRALPNVSSKCIINSKILNDVGNDYSQFYQNDIFKNISIEFSFLYFNFALWVLEYAIKNDVKKIYFSARDGYIYYKYFKLITKTNKIDIDAEYLYISRASLYPSLIFTDEQLAKELYTHAWDSLSIKEALGRLSLSIRECSKLLDKHKIKRDNNETALLRSTNFLNFLEEIWPLVKKKNQKKFDLTKEYLSQAGILTSEKSIIVDIGWHGSLQRCIEGVLSNLKIEKDLTGLYLGLFTSENSEAADMKTAGYLVNHGNPSIIHEMVRSGPSVIELFHTAKHGSVLGYKQSNRQIIPILENSLAEQKQFDSITKYVQSNYFNKISKLIHLYKGHPLSPANPETVAKIALRSIYNPTMKEAQTIGKMKISTDFKAKAKGITITSQGGKNSVSTKHNTRQSVSMWRAGSTKLNSRN